jgi:hypothetical protein
MPSLGADLRGRMRTRLVGARTPWGPWQALKTSCWDADLVPECAAHGADHVPDLDLSRPFYPFPSVGRRHLPLSIRVACRSDGPDISLRCVGWLTTTLRGRWRACE